MNSKSIHYVSGLSMIIFIIIHLFNHLMSIYGAEVHIFWMNKLRLIYRHPVVESLLILSVIVQIISGIKLVRTNWKVSLPFAEKLQMYSGIYLAFFLMIHVSAVFAGRYFLSLDTNFYFGVAGLNSFPVNLFFIPYYSLAILSFFIHTATIHSKKMKFKLLGLNPQNQALLILIFGFVLLISIIYGLTNQFRGVEIPEAYHILTGR